MTKKTNPRKDFTQTAFDVFQQATGEIEGCDEELKKKKALTEKITPDENEKSEDKTSK